MSELERRILETLVEMDNAVRTLRAPGPKADLQGLFARLDGLAEQLPEDADAQLRHYLTRKSYEKARRRLEGLENARGACG